MKPSIFRLTALIAFFVAFSGILSTEAQCVVTFQADMSGAEIEDGTIVGIRGNMAPLSWLETLPIEDPDKDGIYSVSVEFTDGKTGDRVMYKYMSGETWDVDRFGPGGNRVVTLCECELVMPVEKWDILDGFAYEILLEHANNSEFGTWVYIIGSAKKRGVSPEKATMEFIEFWGGDYSWIESPAQIMLEEQFNQQRYQQGYFKEIENTPERVVFKSRKVGAEFIRDRCEDGEWMGVSEEDITAIYKTWLETVTKEKGWSLDWKDAEENAIITIEVQKGQ